MLFDHLHPVLYELERNIKGLWIHQVHYIYLPPPQKKLFHTQFPVMFIHAIYNGLLIITAEIMIQIAHDRHILHSARNKILAQSMVPGEGNNSHPSSRITE
jgi:hypothetical protein